MRRAPWAWSTWDDVRDQMSTAPPATPTVPSTFCSSIGRYPTMECFNDVSQHLRPVVVKALEVHVGDWLDTRGNRNIEKSERSIARVFAVERFNALTVNLHRECARALTVPTPQPLTVWRPIEELCSDPVCRRPGPPLCQCSRWHGQTVAEAHVLDVERTIRALRDDLQVLTEERDGLQRSLGDALRKVEKAKAALNGDLIG